MDVERRPQGVATQLCDGLDQTDVGAGQAFVDTQREAAVERVRGTARHGQLALQIDTLTAKHDVGQDEPPVVQPRGERKPFDRDVRRNRQARQREPVDLHIDR